VTDIGSVAVVGADDASALLEPIAGDIGTEAGTSIIPPLTDPVVELDALGGALVPLLLIGPREKRDE